MVEAVVATVEGVADRGKVEKVVGEEATGVKEVAPELASEVDSGAQLSLEQ